MISSEAIAYFVVMLIIGLTVPVGISLAYVFIKKDKFTNVLAGAITFALAAIVLESIPKAILFQLPGPISRFFNTHSFALIIIAALLAGLFEETGRYITFKYILKHRTARSTSIAYGLGHGLFEVMYLYIASSIQYLIYIQLINSGSFDSIIEQARIVSPEQADALASIPAALAGITFSALPLSIFERVGAVLFHVGASILVFYAVKMPGKKWFYPLAIILHTLLDIFAGFGQLGIISNIYVLEAVIFVFGLLMFLINYIFLYNRDKKPIDQ